MEDQTVDQGGAQQDLRQMVRSVIEEFVTVQKDKAEPAYKAELQEERRRRETLERRVNELVEENSRSRQLAEESDRNSQIRAELQRLGVSKIDLAFRVVKDDVVRTAEGGLAGRGQQGEIPLREYLNSFVQENPEFLPARMSGGSGVQPKPRGNGGQMGGVDLERIKPGMSAEELQRVREHISQVALQNLRGE